MESLWNIPEKVDLIRFVAQWLAVISTIIALIFAMRFSVLKRHADLAKTKIDLEQRTLLENKIQEANKELENTIAELNNR